MVVVTITQCLACSTQKETPQHYLVECPMYMHKRRKLKLKKGELEAKFVEIVVTIMGAGRLGMVPISSHVFCICMAETKPISGK